MKRPLIVANWKLYVTNRDGAQERARRIARKSSRVRADFVLCVPLPFIETVGKVVAGKHIGFGAQNVSLPGEEKRTGEVTAQMVASTGATHVIVGHSERRAMGETNDECKKKVESVLKAGLSAILCVGESNRDAMSGGHFSIIGEQLRASLPKLLPKESSKLIIAYEPIWAIGKTAKDAMSPEMLEETVIYIRKELADIVGRAAALKIPVLYGGSVESENARALMMSGASGFLVGHASVDPDSLIDIATQAGGGKADDPVRDRKRKRFR